MLTAEENEILCRVEGEAPMGQMMRRHWIPACMSEEVEEADGKPVRIRLLGEDLVVFRDTKGRLGVLDEYCAHRRVSLALGRNEECGLRCLYHGWKYDFEGNALELPTEPPSSRLIERVRQKSYPSREGGGLVWVYMGPAAAMPAFEPPVWQTTPDTHIAVLRMHVAANWAQVLEGAIDSAHSSLLHSTNIRPGVGSRTVSNARGSTLRPTVDKAPRLQVQRTSYGMRYVAIRKPSTNEETHDYMRITAYIAPFTVLIPPNTLYDPAQLMVPLDDENTMFYFVITSDRERIDQEAWRKASGARVGVDLDTEFRKIRTRANDFLQDRQAMRLGDFSGIYGVPNQDMAMSESMGERPIADRTRETLGASDTAIAQFRRIMIDGARAFAAGGPPVGTAMGLVREARVQSYEGIVPKGTDWRRLGVGADDLALLDDDASAA
jgi:phthalate 4,5-dioxygenase oxygenase subunit